MFQELLDTPRNRTPSMLLICHHYYYYLPYAGVEEFPMLSMYI
jgi:hypothetical protein